MKTWIIVFLSAGVLILLYLILKDPKRIDTHNDRQIEVVVDNNILRAQEAQYRRAIDSLSIDNYRLDSANKSLKIGQASTQHKLDTKVAEVRTYIAQIREINQDTGYFGHLLDSLEQQVASLQFLVVQYEQYADSISNVNDSIKINYEAIASESGKRIAELQASYDKLYKAYTELFATTTDLQKDLRRQKLKTKVAAVLGGALTILALLK